MDIVRQLRRTAVKVSLEREMATYTAWKEDSELLYRAANEIEKLRSELDKRDAPLQKACSEGKRTEENGSAEKVAGWLERALR